MRAFVRSIPHNYDKATTQKAKTEKIDVAKAILQHSQYVKALASFSVQVKQLSAYNLSPDSCFIEDMALVTKHKTLILRSGNTTRQKESQSVAEELKQKVEIEFMSAPACADGGDILQLGNHIFVGLSQRTNRAGLEIIKTFFQPLGYIVKEVAVKEHLHLKCACSAPTSELVIVAQDTYEDVFANIARVVVIPKEELYAANTVSVGKNILVAKGYPKTLEIIQGLGFNPTVLDMSEIRKGDGSLSCLSLFY